MAYYYVSKGETSTGIILNEDYMTVLDGGVAIETTANEYGVLYVWSGGTANSTTVNAGGEFHISSGGTANKVKIDSGDLTVYRGGAVTEIEWTPCVGSVTVENGAHATFASTYTGVYYGSDGQLIESTTEPMNDRKLNDERQSMYVMSDGIANRTVVYFSGCQHVCSGGTVNSTWVRAEGNLLVSSGGTASDTTLDAYSNMAVFSGGAANNTIVNSGTFNLSGGVADGVTLNANGGLLIEDGGKADNVAIKPQGTLVVSSGSANVTEWTPGKGNVMLYGDAQVTFASEYSGVYYGDGENLISSAAEMNDAYLDANYYELYVMNGGRAINTTVDYYSYMAIFSGGTADVVSVGEGATLFVNSGGTANSATMIGRWGSAYVNSGGTANSATVNSDCFLNVYGLTDFTAVNSGGRFTILKTGKADHTTVNSDGRLQVYGSAENTAISGGSALVLDGKMTGTELTAFGMSAGYLDVSSGGAVENTTVNADCRLFIFKNGTAINTTVNEYGSMYVSGSAENTTISGGEVLISSGGTMTKTTVDPNGVFTIYEGGSADSATVAAGGMIYITEGATATNITAADGALLWLAVAPDTYAQGTYAGSAFVEENGILSGYTARYVDGGLGVASGGTATDITVAEGAQIRVDSDGVLDGITLTGGYMYIENGGKLTGKMSFDDGANERIWTYDGAIVDFDLTRIAPGDEVLVNNLAAIQGNGQFTLTVDGTEENGEYKLADSAAGFNKTITVVDTSGESQGSLWIGGDTLIFGDHSYKLVRDGSLLSVTVGDPLPPNGPLEPLNDYLYDKKKAPALNTNVTEAYGTHLTEAGQEVFLDQNGSIDHDGYHNRIEKAVKGETRDATDYAKIVLEHSAKLSFHAEATAAATFTVYNLIYNEKKDTYSLKKLQTLKLADKDKDGVFTADSKKPVDLPAAGEYYVSMQYADKRKDVSEAYYNVRLNGVDKGTEFFLDADDGWNNYLYDKKTKTLNPSAFMLMKTDFKIAGIRNIEMDCEKPVAEGAPEVEGGWSSFVGFGDAADFARINPYYPADATFSVTATGASKFTVWGVTYGGTDTKTGNKLYTMKALKTVTLKKNATTGLFSAAINDLLLDRLSSTSDYYVGYYVSMEATSPKKDTCVYYNATVDNHAYWSADSGGNKYLYDKKKDPANYNPNLYTNNLDPGGEPKKVYVDSKNTVDGGFYPGGEYKSYSNFVGFGDEWDYAEISLSGPGTLSFTVDAYSEGLIEKASANLKFTVYSLEKVVNGGKVIWKQKTLLATQTITVDKQIGYVNEATIKKTVSVKEATSDDVKYFVSVQSVGAKKGASVYYNVWATLTSFDESALTMPETASDASALSMPETDNLGISDALSFGQYDADVLADASASSLAELDDKSAWQNSLLA